MQKRDIDRECNNTKLVKATTCCLVYISTRTICKKVWCQLIFDALFYLNTVCMHLSEIPEMATAVYHMMCIFSSLRYLLCCYLKAAGALKKIAPFHHSDHLFRNLDSHDNDKIATRSYLSFLYDGNLSISIMALSYQGVPLTHWARETHICVSKLTIIDSDNGSSPGRRQAVVCTNDGILLIGPLGTNLIEILSKIRTFSFKKMHFVPVPNVIRPIRQTTGRSLPSHIWWHLRISEIKERWQTNFWRVAAAWAKSTRH